MQVLLDTNFLIDLIRFKVVLEEISPLVSESYTLATVDTVMDELMKISMRKTKEGRYAKLVLQMLGTYDIRIYKLRKQTDDALLSLAKDKNIVVATNDVKLRKKLTAMKRKSIYLKAKKHLAIG